MIMSCDGTQLYAQFAGGGIVSLGGTMDSVSFRFQPGEVVIPKDALQRFYATAVTASGTFSGTCHWWDYPAPVPDQDGWEPRIKWDR